ncbi:hypothetical protein GCM10022205_23570 [Spinactinospora alkalitolerans]
MPKRAVRARVGGAATAPARQAPSAPAADPAALLAEAERLRRAERYTQAAEVLTKAIDGADLPERERLRLLWQRAGLAVSARDHRDALRQYEELLPQAVEYFGSGSEPVVDCRRQIADCLALLGEMTAAADALRDLYTDRYAAEPRGREALEIGRRIGAILEQARDHRAAEAWLREIADHAVAGRGPDDALSRAVVTDWMRVRDAIDGVQGERRPSASDSSGRRTSLPG